MLLESVVTCSPFCLEPVRYDTPTQRMLQVNVRYRCMHANKIALKTFFITSPSSNTITAAIFTGDCRH